MCTKNFCDYENYFADQAGGKLEIAYYRAPYQRGYGRFSSFAKRYGIPALKYLLKQGFEFGKNIYQDIRSGKDVRQSAKSNIKRSAASAMHDIGQKISQSGSGMRKKPKLKINK